MTTMQRTAGFSLVEVMCAILILGIGLVGLTHGLTTALRSSKDSELQTTAALMAAGQVETLRASGSVQEGVEQGDGGSGLELYRWKQSVTRTATDGLYEVDVVVENSQSGKPIYDLRTLLFDPSSYSAYVAPTNRTDSDKPRKRSQRKR